MSTIAHFSLAQYDSMIASGVFGSRGRQRMEFIQGEVREMTPLGPKHERGRRPAKPMEREKRA